VLSLCFFLATFGGLGLSVFPYVVPESVTIWEAASPLNSQLFMIVGVALLVPIVLAYTFRIGSSAGRSRSTRGTTHDATNVLRFAVGVLATAVVRRPLRGRDRVGGCCRLRSAPLA
jgi:hypothetical protein